LDFSRFQVFKKNLNLATYFCQRRFRVDHGSGPSDGSGWVDNFVYTTGRVQKSDPLSTLRRLRPSCSVTNNTFSSLSSARRVPYHHSSAMRRTPTSSSHDSTQLPTTVGLDLSDRIPSSKTLRRISQLLEPLVSPKQ